MPCPLELTRRYRLAAKVLKVRTVAGLPPKPIFTRLMQALSLGYSLSFGIKPSRDA